jgi:lysine-specific demethylase 3
MVKEPIYEKASIPPPKPRITALSTVRIKLKEPGDNDDLARERARKKPRRITKVPIETKVNTKGAPKKAEEGLTVDAKDVITVQGALYVAQTTSCSNLLRKVAISKCSHCCSHKGGDTCRFRNIRAFPVQQKEDARGYILSVDATESFIFHYSLANRHQEPVFPDQDKLNRTMEKRERQLIMLSCAKALAPIFDDASCHISQSDVLYRRRELDVSETCDFCSTGIFASSYLCRLCGHEYCLPCHSNLVALTNEAAAVKGCNELFHCGKSSKPLRLHSYRDLIPVTRFSVEEINENLRLMRGLIREYDSTHALDAKDREDGSGTDSSSVLDVAPTCRKKHKPGAIVPSHQVATFDQDTLDEEDFLQEWSQGVPIVVENVKSSIVWTPELLTERYGDDECDIVRCDVDPPVEEVKKSAKSEPSPENVRWHSRTTIRDFFSTFSMSMNARRSILGEGIWKLKDWPPTDSLKTALPDIYEDFSNAVPMSDYTRRNGCKNISSYFATNANAPDLGPKMYNAWPGGHRAGEKGTTRLHMDVADAVNILLFASNAKQCNAKLAGAQWDIFRVQDADAIRTFIREKFGDSAQGDPIHSQIHFLDDDLLSELYQSKGVHSYRIVQRRGQAIFVPAGCAHQVCNLTDCIKIATDFISPQSVARCFKLTEEFRNLSSEHQKSWKADMLQLRLQLWYAWSACRLMTAKEGERREEEEEEHEA